MESVSYTPDPLPLDDDDYIVIAPFWADVDIRIGGEIYYRESTDPPYYFVFQLLTFSALTMPLLKKKIVEIINNV